MWRKRGQTHLGRSVGILPDDFRRGINASVPFFASLLDYLVAKRGEHHHPHPDRPARSDGRYHSCPAWSCVAQTQFPGSARDVGRGTAVGSFA